MSPLLSAKKLFAVAILAFALVGASLLSSKPPLIAERSGEKIFRLARKSDVMPDISSEAAIVKRLKTGEALFERNVGQKLPIASLTKLMSALILAEMGEPLAEMEFSEDAKLAGQPDDKRSQTEAGERVKTEDIIKMMLVSSYNDAAYAAAENVAVSKRPELDSKSFQERVSFFVELMNRRAQTIGLANTHFANPAGSDDPDNFSTAQDIAELSKFINDTNPELWTSSRIQEIFIFGKAGRRYDLVNTNPLLKEYPSIYGSKTGFEDQAKGTLLILYQVARQDNVAIVILGSNDRFRDGKEAIRWLESNFVLESQ